VKEVKGEEPVVAGTPARRPPATRERFRAQVRQEVKETALRQIAESGSAGLSVAAIGKQLGVSGPALYRYFASRDELLSELVIDAYHDLADALRAAASPAGASPAGAGPAPSARLEALIRAYRSWALAQPHRYELLFEPPRPDYGAHAQRIADAAQDAMTPLFDILPDSGRAELAPVGQPLSDQLAAWGQARGVETDPRVALRAILIWSRLHGFVSLEIHGNFAAIGIDPNLVFEGQITALTM
jgi:AcrR family transcriptional regulator